MFLILHQQKLLEYMRKHYIAHKKQLFGHFKDPRVIKFILWLVLEMLGNFEIL